MTAVLVALYALSAVGQLGGVALVVREALDARSRWQRYVGAVAGSTSQHPADIAAKARRGITYAESRTVVEMTRELLRFNARRQATAVALLTFGILTGLAADIVGATR